MSPHSPLHGWCLVEGDPVLLDVAADRYVRLAGPPARALLALADGGAADAEGLDALRAGIGIDPERLGPACRHKLPSRALGADPSRRPDPLSLLRAMVAQLRIRHRLRRHGLARLIDRATVASGHARPPRSDIATLVSAHAGTRRILLSRDACLVRAFALAGAARSRGHRADIVFGVQLRPFAAHCWVERDGMLLDDALDHVRCFHPILVL